MGKARQRKLARQQQESQDAALLRLRAACIAIADARWVSDDETYNPVEHGPLHNHCGPVAEAVRRTFGGEVRACVFLPPGRDNDRGPLLTYHSHIWNVLPGGREVDLTSDQYGGDGLHVLPLLEGRGKPGVFGPQGQQRNEAFWRALVRSVQATVAGAGAPKIPVQREPRKRPAAATTDAYKGD